MLSTVSKTQSSDRHGGALKLHRGATFGEVSIARSALETASRPAFPANGTVLADNYLNSGVAAHSANKAKRGGARNNASRESHCLTGPQVANLIAAARHADAIGLPFNRMITIHWKAAGVPLEGMAKATGHFTDLLTKALARHGSETAWLWVHENGEGKGWHCHLLAHVPADRVKHVTGLQRRWLRNITGKAYRKRVIHSDPIGGRIGLEKSNRDLHAANHDAVLAYVLKGTSPDVVSQFALAHCTSGGHIIGKRCGTSQNIAAKARSHALALGK